MNGSQQLVGWGGLGLVGVDFWLGGQRGTVAEGLFGTGSTASAHSALLRLGGEALFVVVATILAGVNDSLGTVMVVAIVGLWILWAMNHYGNAGKSSTASTSNTGA